MDEPPQTRTDRAPLALFCAVLSLCLLVYAGRTFTIDDFTLLASAANLGSAGRLDINELAYTEWDLPPPHSLGAFGPSGDYYSKKAPAPAWLGALLFRLGIAVPWLGNGAAALLLSPLLTAATAVLLYSLARRMGYGRGVARSGGLLYGGASMALVYSRFLLGEPVMAFGLALAAWGAYRARHSRERETGWALVCGLGAGLAAAGNLALAPLAAIFAVYLAAGVDWRLALRRLVGAGAAFGACVAMVGAYNLVRFGTALESGYHFAAGEGFSTPLALGVYGLLLSPARGLMWFNPLTWLALPGWWLWRRRAPAEAWLSLALVAAQVVIFSAWWAWAGGVSWGPRFLLPAVPFLTLAALPALERARGPWRAGCALVVLAAVAVQGVGATADVNPYEGELSAQFSPGEESQGPAGYPHGWRALTDPALSPIGGNARLLAERGPEVAWFREGRADWAALGVLAVALAGALAALASDRAGRRVGVGVALLTLIAANVALSRAPSPVTGGGGEPLRALPGALAEHAPGDVLLVLTPDLTWALVELTDRPPAVGLPRGAWHEDAQVNALFARALEGASRAWLLTYEPPPPSWYEERLRAAGRLVDERALDGYRLAVYALDAD